MDAVEAACAALLGWRRRAFFHPFGRLAVLGMIRFFARLFLRSLQIRRGFIGRSRSDRLIGVARRRKTLHYLRRLRRRGSGISGRILGRVGIARCRRRDKLHYHRHAEIFAQFVAQWLGDIGETRTAFRVQETRLRQSR